MELLQEVAQVDLESVVARLDTTEVIVRGGDGPTNARLVLAVANIVARLFPAVSFETGSRVVDVPPFGRGSIQRLASETVRLARVVEPGEVRRRYVIDTGANTDDANLYVAADSWTVGLSRTPVQLDGFDSGPAVSAAASLVGAHTFLDVLPEVAGHRLGTAPLLWNLLDYRLTAAPVQHPFEEVNAVCFGAGSVGSSLVLALLLSGASGCLGVVDPDRLSPRNKVRYPLWLGEQDGLKVDWLQQCASTSSLQVHPYAEPAESWVRGSATPLELAIAAVDSVAGRRQVADSLARVALNAGVDGLRLHVSRHGFGGSRGCVYCPYVDAGDVLDDVGMYADLTGLSPERVNRLLGGDVICRDDAVEIIARKGVSAELEDLIGGRLQDVVRARLYAQAEVPARSGGLLAVSAPFVSAMAGALLAAEVLKGPSRTADFRLSDRVDVDCSGVPSGFTVATSQDRSGRCLCHDPFRLRAHRKMWS